MTEDQRRAERGFVSAGGPDSRYGVRVDGAVVVLQGNQRANRFTGSNGDDLIVSGGAKSQFSDLTETEVINGRGGRDTVILPGRQEEYVASMPGAGEYPSERSGRYEGNPTLYGTGIILTRTNPETGYEERLHLQDISRVGFDTSGKYHSSPPTGAVESVRNGIQDGSITMVTTAELRAAAESGMTSQEIEEAKLAGTLAATRVMDSAGMGGNFEEHQRRAIEAARQANPDITSLRAMDPARNNPTSRLDEMLGLTTTSPDAVQQPTAFSQAPRTPSP